MITTGKWTQPGVPHKGWTCTNIDDLGEPSFICEMCEVICIRYVHTMEHPDYSETLRVGCICAGNMEQDIVGARKRESNLKRGLARRNRFVTREWCTSQRGNSYLNAEGFNIVVFSITSRKVCAIVRHRTNNSVPSKRVYRETEESARLAAWDILQEMKARYSHDENGD